MSELINTVEYERMHGWVLEAYCLSPNLDTPYGFISERGTEGLAWVYIEGGIYEGEEFVVLVRTAPGESTLHGVEYGLDVPPDAVSAMVGAWAYATGEGYASYPVHYVRRMAYRDYYESEAPSDEWRSFYHDFIYKQEDWPGDLEKEAYA